MQSIGSYAVAVPSSQYANINSLSCNAAPGFTNNGVGTKVSGFHGIVCPEYPLFVDPFTYFGHEPIVRRRSSVPSLFNAIHSLHNLLPFSSSSTFLAAVSLHLESTARTIFPIVRSFQEYLLPLPPVHIYPTKAPITLK